MSLLDRSISLSPLSSPANRRRATRRDEEDLSSSDPTITQVDNPLFLPRRQFVELLLAPDLEVISALCEVVLVPEEDRIMAEAILDFFEAHNRTDRLLEWAIGKEIRKSNSISTLFRDTCEATKLMPVLYTKLGNDYLKHIAGPLVKDVVGSGASFEIDPRRAEKGVNVKENMQKLLELSSQFLHHIYQSIELCPSFLRRVIYHAEKEISIKFPNAGSVVIGVFFFSRFLIPAIVSPKTFGLLPDTPSPEGQRGLILISKLLQNLANGNEFEDTTEEYKSDMNQFVIINTPHLQEFFSNLILDDKKLGGTDIKFYHVSSEMLNYAMNTISSSLQSNKDEIYSKLGRSETKMSFLQNYGRYNSFLQILGSAEGLQKSNPSTRSLVRSISGEGSWRLTPGKKRLEKLKNQLKMQMGNDTDKMEKMEKLLEEEFRERKIFEKKLADMSTQIADLNAKVRDQQLVIATQEDTIAKLRFQLEDQVEGLKVNGDTENT